MPDSGTLLTQLAQLAGKDYVASGAIKECFALLVDAFEQQALKLSKLEDVVAAYGSPLDEDVTVWNKLANKADAKKVDRLQQQVVALQTAFDTGQLHQAASAPEQERIQRQLATLKQQVAHIEDALGCAPGAQHGSSLHQMFGCKSSDGSAFQRLEQLEEQVHALSVALASKEAESAQAHATMREIEALNSQLKNIRADAKQAILLSGSAIRAEAEAQLAARTGELERKLVSQVEAVEALLESRIAAATTRTSAALSGEVDRRVAALYESLDLQIRGLQDQIDKLAADKADVASLSDYANQVTEVFEEVAGTVADRAQVGLDALTQQLAQQHEDLAGLAAAKADMHELEALHRQTQAQQDALARDISEVREAVTDLPEMHNSLKGLEAEVAALNTASASASAALDASLRRMQQLSECCDDLTANLSHIASTVVGTSCTASPAARHATVPHSSADGSGSAGSRWGQPRATATAPGCITARLAEVERAVQEVSSSISAKASAAAVAELGRQLEGVKGQAARNAEGVRNLTSSTYKRVDEHASAIQRLAATIGSSMDDRPTCAAVRTMIQAATEEAAQRWEAAVADAHEECRGLDAALAALNGDVAAAQRESAGAREAQAEMRSMLAARDEALHGCVERVAIEQGAIRESVRQLPGMCRETTATLVKEQVAQQLQASDSQRRLGALESQLRTAAATVQRLEEETALAARQLDRHSGMLSALERATAAAAAAQRASSGGSGAEDVAAAAKAAVGQLRLELVQQLEVQVGRMAGLEEAVREGREALREGLRAAEHGWQKELCEAAQQEEVRWQVWLEQFAGAMEQRITAKDLAAAIRTSEQRMTAQVNDSISTCSRQAAEASAATTALDKRVAGLEKRVKSVEASSAAAASASTATAKQLAQLEAVVLAKADKGAVERQLAAVRAALADRPAQGEVEAALAQKLDIRTFLAASSANARAVGAAGALAALGPARGSAGSNGVNRLFAGAVDAIGNVASSSNSEDEAEDGRNFGSVSSKRLGTFREWAAMPGPGSMSTGTTKRGTVVAGQQNAELFTS